MITIMNDDGTIFNPPTNPLTEKWEQLYPVCKNGLSYRCMFCNKRPYGDYWKVPKEDMEIYEEYKREYDEYLRAHNDLCEKL